MKLFTIPPLGLATLAGISLASQAFAFVSIDYVTVGNAGNAADTVLPNVNYDAVPTNTGYGAVGYDYKVGKYEVTNAQYGEFLNAKGASNSYGIYNPGMASYVITRSGTSGEFSYSVTEALANRPVVYVSWFDAARFANWLTNNQGSGDTETGAYTLNGAMSGITFANIGTTVRLPSENEWYKAAYYNGDTSNYSLYPNGQNSITIADANYSTSVGSSTDAGTYSGDASFYGTFDQGGNVWEWNYAIPSLAYYQTGRGLRGGAWNGDATADTWLDSNFRNFTDNYYEYSDIGFRLVTVPEPTSLVLAMLAGGAMLTRRKR